MTATKSVPRIHSGDQMLAAVYRLENQYGSMGRVPDDDPTLLAIQKYNSKIHRRGNPVGSFHLATVDRHEEKIRVSTKPPKPVPAPVAPDVADIHQIAKKSHGRTMTPEREEQVKEIVMLYMTGKTFPAISARTGATEGAIRRSLLWAKQEGLLPAGQRIKVIRAVLGDDEFVGTKADAAKHFSVPRVYFKYKCTPKSAIQWAYTGRIVFEVTKK